jgi:hypothetical protein
VTSAQHRLIDIIRSYGDAAEYWPVVNDWVKDNGPQRSLALRNINRTVEFLVNTGVITIDDDGIFRVKGVVNT